jgi:ADP-ribose pyrophosphatase
MDAPLLSSENLYEGHGWKLTLDSAPLPDGRVKKIARAHRSDSAHILAFPSSGNDVLLLREFRPFYGDWIWMLPSGKVDKEDDHRLAALRELREETGFTADEISFYFSANYFEGLVAQAHVYVARTLRKDPLPQDATELIEVHAVSLSEAIEKVESSPVIHTISAYALQRYAREHSA